MEESIMLEELKQKVYDAEETLWTRDPVAFSWGNVSGLDAQQGLVVMRPRSVRWQALSPKDMVVVRLDNGETVEGSAPPAEARAHLELYRAFPSLGGIVHTHSLYASAWAQAGRDIPCYGITHADYFYGSIPCTRHLSQDELDEDYPGNMGKVIVETFLDRCLEPSAIPGVICRGHGPFTWGKDPAQAVRHAVVLERVAEMALLTREVDPFADPSPRRIVDKHYFLKHGPSAGLD